MSLGFQDKKRQEWISLLFDAYAIVDEGVAIAIKEQKKTKGRIACAKGCFNCCKTHKDIPVYPHEITGIYWYVIEELPRSIQEILKLQLLEFKEGGSCPFLLDGLCSIHKVRPAACRLFNVFGRPCSRGEDPYYTRKEDILIPKREYIQKAFIKILPFYGIKDKGNPLMAEDFIRSQAMVLQKIDWRALGRRLRG